MWDFSNPSMTFDNPGYLFDGTAPGGGGLPSPVLPPGTPAIYGGRVTIPAKKLGETVIIPFDFISKLSVNETIISAVCFASVYTGIDPSPSSMIAGTATIQGTIINQLIAGGVLGTIYDLLCRITTSLGQVIELTAFLAVIPDLP